MRHCSRIDLSALEAGLAALRGRSTRRERWAHAGRELSVLAHARLVLREPVRWHPRLALRERAGTVGRAVLLAVDVVPAALAAPGERTTTVPVLDDDDRWGFERRPMRREWRAGRWGWWDPVRGKWYPSLSLSGGASITFGAVAGNWSDATKWVGGVRPGTGDDVLLTAASANCSVDSATLCVCRSLDCTGYTGSLVINASSTLLNGDAAGGSFKLVAGMTFTSTNGLTSLVKFVSTSTNGGTGWPITWAGKTGSCEFAGVGGKWVLQDALVTGGALSTLTVTSGAFFGNGKSITAGTFASSNANTRTVDITNCSVSMPGTAAATWNLANTNGLTLTTTGSTLTFTGAGGGLSHGGSGGNGATYPTVVMNAAGIATLNAQGGGGSTITNFTRTTTAVKTDALNVAAGCTITNLTIGGGSTQGANRQLVASSTRGTSRALTCTAVTISGDVDFMDVNIAGSPSWTNAGACFIGVCGNNGGAVPTNATASVTQTHTTSAGGSYSDGTKWTSRTPLPQDNVIVDANTSGTLAIDMPRVGKDLTFTGFAGTATWGSGVNCEMYGSLVLATGMTFNQSNQATLAGRGSHTVTMATKSFSNGTVNINGPGGTYTLADAFSSTIGVVHTGGTLDVGGQTATMLTYAMSNALATLAGTGTINLTQTTAVSVWSVTAGTVTFTGTIAVTTTSANTRVFAGGGKTYGSLVYTVAGSTGILSISGSNTWSGTWTLSDATNNRAVTVTNGTAQTFTATGAFFLVSGTAGKITTLASTSGGSPFTLTKTSGAAVVVDFVSVTDSTATGGLWVDGSHYTNGGGNTGWTFADAVPAGAETGAGADDASVSVAFSGADTGGGVDAATVSFSAADTGAGVDAGALAAAAAGTDAGSGADAGVVTSDVQVAGTETGTGTETGSPAAAAAGAELGAGADAAMPAASIAAAEQGAGVDSSSLAAASAGSDTGSGTDAPAVAAAIAGADAGTGADDATPAVAAAGTETASSADGGTLTASLSAAETGSGIDAATPAAALSGQESAQSVDSGAVATNTSGSEQGQGSEQGAVGFDLFGSEAAVAAEFAAIVAAIAGAEQGAGVDLGEGGVLVLGSDTGAGADASSVRLAVLLLEVGRLLERWTAGPLEPAGWGTRGIIGRITAGP